jgi:hypothetical protein
LKFAGFPIHVVKQELAMKIVKPWILLFMLLSPAWASAYHIEDMRVFNKKLDADHVFQWSYNLEDFGFIPNRDTIAGRPILELKLYGFSKQPCENWGAHPFISLYIDQARIYGIACENFVVDNGGASFSQETQRMDIYLKVDKLAMLEYAILRFDFEPGPSAVSEPGALILLAGGLLMLMRRRWRQ